MCIPATTSWTHSYTIDLAPAVRKNSATGAASFLPSRGSSGTRAVKILRSLMVVQLLVLPCRSL